MHPFGTAIRVLDLISVVLVAWVTAVFYGPWAALTRSMDALPVDTFLAVTKRMSANLGPLMTVLMPVTLLVVSGLCAVSYGEGTIRFGMVVVSLFLLSLTLAVTLRVEVPLTLGFTSWTAATMPSDWQERRNRWQRFHCLRVFPAITALVLLVAKVVFLPR